MKAVNPLCQNRAFTLIELLCVTAIISVLAVLSPLALNSMLLGNQISSGLQALGGTLDLARQHAISKNTYVWVVFNFSESGPKVGVISAKNGTDSLMWNQDEVDVVGSTDFELLGKITELAEVRIADTPTVAISGLPETDTTPAELAVVNLKVKSTTFTRAIQFTPTGEARVNSSVVRFIDLVMLPRNGDSPNQAVLRVAGLVGKTSIYRN